MGATKTENFKAQKLTASVAAEVLDLDVDRLLNDERLPEAIMTALSEHGVLVFRDLRITDDEQLEFARRLGGTDLKITEISANETNPIADFLQETVEWHMDGTTRGLIPDKATLGPA